MSEPNPVRVLLLALIATLCFPREASTLVVNTQLTITVVDAADRAVSDARIELAPVASVPGNDLTGVQKVSVPCDDLGRCTASHVPAGEYTITVLRPSGFATVREALVLRAGSTQSLLIRVKANEAVLIATLGTVRVKPTGVLSTNSAPVSELDTQRLAASGKDLGQALSELDGITLIRAGGGAPALPIGVALRGSDPKETIIQLDGEPVNNSSTGDLDVSLLDPSSFSKVQVVYGLAPASLVGANTEGGTINFHTLDPTAIPHGVIRCDVGTLVNGDCSFATTGTTEKLGYAFEAQRQTTHSSVEGYPIIDANSGAAQTLGSGLSRSSGLAKLRYAPSANAFFEGSVLSIGSSADLSGPLSSPMGLSARPGGVFNSFAGSARYATVTFYNADLKFAVGRKPETSSPADAFVTLRHMTTVDRQWVTGPASGFNEHLVDSTDRISDDDLEYERELPNADLALVFRSASERLTVPDQFGTATPTQGQLSSYFLARYLWNGGPKLRYTAAVYQSYFSTFGSSLDPRLGIVWLPNPRTAVRASVGTGFQAPLLSEKIVPAPLPPPDPSGLIFVGNPQLSADHTTEYELDLEQFLGGGGRPARAELDLYRTNLRGDDLQFVPSGASPASPQLSYPVNLRSSVAQGIALRMEQPLGQWSDLEASYDVNASYPLSLPPSLINAVGNIVPFEQSQGVPLRRATLALRHQHRPLTVDVTAAYRDVNNDLNAPAFTLVSADMTYAVGHVDIGVAATNLTNAISGPFTLIGRGVPYPGLAGPIATDAYQLQPAALRVSLSSHW